MTPGDTVRIKGRRGLYTLTTPLEGGWRVRARLPLTPSEAEFALLAKLL